MHTFEYMIDEMQKRGYKLTPQRITIVQVLAENPHDHPSLNDIYEQVKARLPTVSFSTLYNTISTLEKIGLLKLFNFQGETRVDMNTKNHINIIHSNTGTILDVNDEKIIETIYKTLQNGLSHHEHILVNIIVY
ncbi:MAG: Fur family transcriptional regulator [Thermoplasmatota archaeon]